jgi:hypothetical protein
LTKAITKRGLSHVVTADKERLSSIRKRVGIRQTKPRLYYQWLQEEFEYGHAKVPRPSKKDHDADVLLYGIRWRQCVTDEA